MTSSTPTPPNRGTQAQSPGTGKFAVVRRARVEHLAAELLRQADAMRIPVPVEQLMQQPPLGLWPASQVEIPANAIDTRLAVAHLIARKAGESNWPARVKLFGQRAFSASEIAMFVVALLLPSPLLNNLNAQQRTPEAVAQMFQVPREMAAQRLDELGYNRPTNPDRSTPATLTDAPAVSSNDTTQ